MTDERTASSTSWHGEQIDDVLRRLDTDADQGLSAAEADRRLERHGPNELPREKRAGPVRIFLRQFTDPLIYILLIAALVALAIGSFANAIFIGAVLLLNATVGAIQEAKAESSAEALQEVVGVRTRVIRDGRRERLDAEELVPGDIVALEAGDSVAADLRLVKSRDVRADESLLTGESTPVEKDAEASVEEDAGVGDRVNMVHAGSSIISGSGIGVVVETGASTEIGAIAEALAGDSGGDPPLVVKLNTLTNRIAYLTLGAIALLSVIQFARGGDPAQIFFLGVALAVSAIPAGLPVAITVALSIASSRMAERNVIVRHLPAVEGLGSCTLICSDKTGTLTANQLTVQRVLLADGTSVDIGGDALSVDAEATVDGEAPGEEVHEQLCAVARAAVLANAGEIRVEDGRVVEADGDSTDLAFLVLGAKLDLERDHLLERHPEQEQLPFDSSVRFGATFNEVDGELIAHAKGAPEKVLEMCGDVDREDVEQRAQELADEGFRLLGIASGRVDGPTAEDLQGLDWLGLVAIIDPLREEVPEAVERCENAGVGVRMLTGDHPRTAFAIGRQLGLAESEDQVMAGARLQEMSEQERPEAIERARVFARVEPLQKTEIVEASQDAGHFVAVTGDGVNDAPALRSANIGIAMGETGTDVARGAADLILTDDNFASIVKGIEQGRIAYENVRKVVWLLLATGGAEVLLFFLALGFGMPIPLTAVQLLWLNLVTNGIQDVALAFEKGEGDVLDMPPRSPDEPIFNRRMIEQVLVSAVYIGTVAFGVYYYLHQVAGMGDAEARNLTLLLMVLFENVHAFTVRSERASAFAVPFRNNPLLFAAVVAAQAVHIAAMFIPGLSGVLGIEPVSPATWGTLLAIAVTLLVFEEAVKLMRKRLSARSP